jgi:predicted ester cyclase
MDMQTNKTIVRKFNMEYIEGGNDDVFYQIIHPDFINHTAPAGVSAGPDGVSYYINEVLKKAFSNLKVEILNQVAEGDQVVTYKAFHATHTGEFMGIAPTGKNITLRLIDIIRLNNGQYTDHWAIRDVPHLMNQLTNNN